MARLTPLVVGKLVGNPASLRAAKKAKHSASMASPCQPASSYGVSQQRQVYPHRHGVSLSISPVAGCPRLLGNSIDKHSNLARFQLTFNDVVSNHSGMKVNQ